MGSGGSGKGSRGRGRRRPRGGGGGRPGGPKGPPAATHSPRKGKAFSTPYEVPDTGPIDPFDLFCACFMGLMPDGTYRGAGLVEVAKRFRRTPGEIKQMLDRYGMDPETLKTVDFDLSLAKLDIQVAPEGIDRREIARGLFEEFCDLHPTLTCAPVEADGNGGRPGGHPEAVPAHASHRREARHDTAAPGDEAPDEGEGYPDAGSEEARDGASEGDEVESPADAEEEGTEDEAPVEEPLATADVGVAHGTPDAPQRPHGPQGASGARFSHEGRPDRPVRQIRRSPTRRGRAG